MASDRELIMEAALAAFFRQAVPDLAGPVRLAPIGGGQSNPTYLLEVGGRRMVLRKKPAGPILPSAHAIEREFRVLEALEGTSVPAPRPILLCEDPDVLGTPFYLMEHLDGRVFADGALPELAPEERRAAYLDMAWVLADLHSVDPAAVGLADFGRPGDYFQRQLARWSRQWAAVEGVDIPDLDRLAAWLAENLPPDDGEVVIAHGDYRIGNLIYHPNEPRVIGVLDWELSTLGHPLADLGFACMAWHTTPDEYGGIAGLDMEGIPTMEEFVDAYMAEAPDVGELRPFHIAFALFRFAVIFVGIGQRAAAGSGASVEGAALAPLAARFAARGLEVAETGAARIGL